MGQAQFGENMYIVIFQILKSGRKIESLVVYLSNHDTYINIDHSYFCTISTALTLLFPGHKSVTVSTVCVVEGRTVSYFYKHLSVAAVLIYSYK